MAKTLRETKPTGRVTVFLRATNEGGRMTRVAAILGAVLALALGASACGGSSSSSSEETTTQASGGGGGGGGGSASGTLEGETGPGFEIEVKKDGKDAERVRAGTYTLKVEDKSDQHNFHLIGPGVDTKVTDVGFVGDKTATVTLKKGTYTYQCDPHASSGMKGTFEVT
jgi:plastocyanin